MEQIPEIPKYVGVCSFVLYLKYIKDPLEQGNKKQ